MIPVVAMAGDAVGTATASSLVTTVTDMAGTMLTTMADNPMLYGRYYADHYGR